MWLTASHNSIFKSFINCTQIFPFSPAFLNFFSQMVLYNFRNPLLENYIGGWYFHCSLKIFCLSELTIHWRANGKPYICQPILHLDHSCLSALHRNSGTLRYIKYSEKFETIISCFSLKTRKLYVCIICRTGMTSFRGTNGWR